MIKENLSALTHSPDKETMTWFGVALNRVRNYFILSDMRKSSNRGGLQIMTIRIAIISLMFLAITSLKIQAQPPPKTVLQQKAFERVFGDAARFDTAMVRKVKADLPGKRHYVDRNGDGKPEEVWFIDTDPRHTESKRPILVRVIDEDHDLMTGKEPDQDSDLYIADWNADGIVDAVVDYEDLDGDQDIDQIGLYSYKTEDDGLWVWWGRDDGDDNLLWYNVDYRYTQLPCQYYSHFGGDETFNYMHLKPGSDTWIPVFENPFLFFDRDKDGITEDVIRIEGEGDVMQYIRWSFDADNDATTGQPRDFDVAIAACAPGWSEEKNRKSDFNLHLNKQQSEILTVRGFKTTPILRRSAAAGFIQNNTWERVLLSWDENDLNRAWDRPKDTIDRWEGIIAAGSKEPGFIMPQIGGPDCGPFNKRYELVLHPTGPNEFYFNPADHRIHIKSSNKTWIKVDYDGDLKADMNYAWFDRNGDGFMDQVTVDVDGDDKVDDSWNTDVSGIKPVKWKFGDINAVFAKVVLKEPSRLYLLDKMLAMVIESMQKGRGQDPVWDLLQHNMRGAKFTEEVAGNLINSDETMMYYLRLIRDRQIAKLKKLGAGSGPFWKSFETARGKDDSEMMTSMLSKMFKTGMPVQDYEKWLAERRDKGVHPHVAWDNVWYPPNWGWESDKAAYRIYDGHFDMFGKRQDTLIYPNIKKGKSYHLDQNSWGMDVLLVGNSAGCGGVTLYINGVAYPVRNEKKPGDPTFTGRLIEETRDKVTIELLAKGVGPVKAPYTVRLRPSALAGRSDSPIEVLIEGGKSGDKIELGIGLTRLKEDTCLIDQKTGIMSLWGFQQPEIGWIGMGIIYPPDHYLRWDHQPEEYRVVLRCETGKPIVYHIQGDWLRGHRFSCCPSAKDWLMTLKETANRTRLE